MRVGECIGEAHVMSEPAKHVPKWLTIDVTVLVVGAVIILAAALWLEPTRDGIVQRVAQSAQSTGQQLWQYATERKKPVVPKLKAPL
jgi:hypothetical protein